jgi:hypothetical protein
MDLVFNNVYLLEAISLTDPSLEVFFKLLMSVPLFARFVKANNGVRQSLYILHDRWLLRSSIHCQTQVYRHPGTLKFHRLCGPAIIYINEYGHHEGESFYTNGRLKHRVNIVRTYN